MTADTVENGKSVFQRLQDILEKSRARYVVHEHVMTRTVEDAERNLSFDVTRLVKTVAFRIRNSGIILAAIRGTRRVDYARLAALAGVNRRDLSSLSPDEIEELLMVEPGCVSPVPLRKDAEVFIDDDVLTILPTLYCGIGRPDRTLEIAPDDLVRLAEGRVGGFSRPKGEDSTKT